jgi:hypothetical protein
MKNKFMILISLIILLFAFSVSGTDIFYNNFNYNTSFVTNGLSYFRTTGGVYDSPIYSNNLSSNACGINVSDPGGAGGFSQYIYSNLAYTITDGIFQSTFKVNFQTGSPVNVVFSNTSFSSDYFNIQFSAGSITTFENTGEIDGMETCSFNTTTAYSYIIVFNYDVVTKKYNFLVSYLNGTNVYSCINKVLSTTPFVFDKFIIRFDYVKLEPTEKFIDDFLIEYASSNYSYLPVNSYCENDIDCLSGLCLNNKCQYKTATSACSNNYECLSNSCINSHCSTPDITAQLNNYWTGAGVVSTGSKLLIGFLIMLILIILIAVMTGANPIACSITGIASLFLVVYLGLFPIWIVVLIVVICAIGFFTFFANRG